MGICCCGKKSQVADKPASHRGSDEYSTSLPALNPFDSAAYPTNSPGLHHKGNDGLDELHSGESKDGPRTEDEDATTSGLHPSRLRRRGAICGETLSHFLKDIKWWSSNADDHAGRASEEALAEREVVRQVLLTHPLFKGCHDDADLMEEMLNAFERQETRAGEVIAVPGEMTAFHVVVKGRAVAQSARAPQDGAGQDATAEKDDTSQDGLVSSRPLQSMPREDGKEVGASGSPSARVYAADKVSKTEWVVGETFGNEGLLYPLSSQYPDASVRAAETSTEVSNLPPAVTATSNTPKYDASVVPAVSSPTPTTASTTVTWRLSRVRYQQLLRLHYDDQLRRILRTLSQCPLFHHLSAVQLFELAERAQIACLDAAVAVLSTHESPVDLLVLMSGTVAVERERPNGYGGFARLQAAVLGPGDCVGDEEWLAAQTDASVGASLHDQAAPSAYTYTTQQPVEAVRLTLKDLARFLAPADLAALRQGSRNTKERDSRREQLREAVRALVEQSLLAHLSESDAETDSEGYDEANAEGPDASGAGGAGHHTGGKRNLLGWAGASAGQPLFVQEALSDDVTVKGADVTNFLLTQFFSRPTYCQADGRERGLSMAAFTARRCYPRGVILFDVDYSTRTDSTSTKAAKGGGAAAAATATTPTHRTSILDTTPTPTPLQPPDTDNAVSDHGSTRADRLYVVVSGSICVVDATSGAVIYTAGRGSSVGEEGLLPPLQCSTAAALHTRAVVGGEEAGEDGCVVYELSARSFRELLRRAYAAGIRRFCSVFCVLPYAEYFPENYWRFLFHCTTEREVVGGDLIAVRGAPCVFVALLLDGQVNAYGGEGDAYDGELPPLKSTKEESDMSGNSRSSAAIATFRRGDIVGGQEAMDGRALTVAYVCECRTRMLCVPARSFGGLFRPAMPYLQTLWAQDRYRAVMQE